MNRRSRLLSLGLSLAVLATMGRAATAATVPVTTNLLVNLNGDSTSNFVSDGTAVQAWLDLAEDGSEASRQDVGQATVSRQPLLAPNTAVPNSALTGVNYTAVDFDRSATVNNTRSSGADSDALRGKDATTPRALNYGDPFTSGPDAAYSASTATTGISWFAVFRSTDDPVINDNNSLPAGNGSGNTSSRWGQQAIIDAHYADATPDSGVGVAWWGTFAVDGADADTQVNMLNHSRTNAGVEFDNPDESVGSGTTGNMNVATWYMIANSLDPVNGVFRSAVTTPDGLGGVTTLVDLTSTDAALINPNGVGDGQSHLNFTLGVLAHRTPGGNNDFSFDGLMAEVLIYNANLSASDFNSVAGYLNRKYFTVQPGDFDGDGDVDGADFVAWQTNFPTAGGATLAEGDADGDGDVDGADFVVWQTNFPFTPGAGVSPVPEPKSIVLLFSLLFGLIGLALSKKLGFIAGLRDHAAMESVTANPRPFK